MIGHLNAKSSFFALRDKCNRRNVKLSRPEILWMIILHDPRFSQRSDGTNGARPLQAPVGGDGGLAKTHLSGGSRGAKAATADGWPR